MAGSNYSFVISSNFKPFSMEEMLVPFTAYKNAYEKAEEDYTQLSDKADMFSYLSETLPPESKARKIYEGYVDELHKQGESLANGLSMANRRALTSLKRRYSGEIGRLDKADTALQEEKKRRLALSTNDPSTLYANDNLSIDDFLDRKEPNIYSVSGQKLYERGVQIGASGSSRIYSNPQVQELTKQYNNIIQTYGYSPELIAQFRNNLAAIPEFQQSIKATLKEYGAEDNLTGVNYDRAMQSVINGVVNGITYKRADNVQQNPDYVTEHQKMQLEQDKKSMENKMMMYGMVKDKDGSWKYSLEADPAYQRQQQLVRLYADKDVPEGFYIDPADPSKPKKVPKGYKADPTSITGLVKDEDANGGSTSAKEKLDNVLLGLTYSNTKNPRAALKNPEGFEVEANGKRYTYKYIGALSPQDGGYVSGAFGTDVPNRGWGFTSASNVMNKWGNFAIDDVDETEKGKVRVLAENEVMSLVSDPVFYDAYKKILPEGITKDTDIQVVEVPNEWGSPRKGYAIAVRQ